MTTDLKVVDNSDPTSNIWTLTFTAPGGDFDVGKAKSYNLKASNSEVDLVDNFDQAFDVPAAMLTAGTLEPEEAGAKVTLTLDLEHESFTLNSGIVYFALRAQDADGNDAVDVSNVVSVVYRDFVPPGATGDFLATFDAATMELAVNFTSAGDDGAEGTPYAYEIRYAKKETAFSAATAEDTEVLDASLLTAGSLVPVVGGEQVTAVFNLTSSEVVDKARFFAVRAIDEFGSPGDFSEVIRVKLLDSEGMSGGEIAGIVIGTLLGVFVISAAVFFGLKRSSVQRSKSSDVWSNSDN